MKTLLAKAQDVVRVGLPYVRAVDVYITPHENFIPKGTQFPAVGIKDGKIRSTRIPGEAKDTVKQVKLIPYVRAYEGERAIMGAGPDKGILDITQDLHAAMEDSFWDIPGMEDISCEEERESEIFGSPGDGLQRKVITYNFEIRE